MPDKGTTMKRAYGTIALLALFTALAALFAGCSNAGDAPTGGSSPVSQMSALEKIEVAFEGGYGRAQIKSKLDAAMALYGLPINEENYGRAGSVLVTMRKENGIEEMRILDHMIRSHVPGINIDFPSAAAISTVAILSGDL